MARTPRTRQRVRTTLLLLSFIAFPITINYFSPYLIVESSFAGVLNGSAIVFALLFAVSLVLGRAWCGWACPAAGLQEPLLTVNGRRVGRRADIVKWVIWFPWLAAIVFGVASAGGYASVDPLYGTVGGISIAGAADRPIVFAYVIYFGVIALFFLLALLVGRRGGCHTVCWMAPFMIVGRWLRNRLGAWPSLRLVADSDTCKECGNCTEACPMSIDVQALVDSPSMEDRECILCGTCADTCPNSVIGYSFSAGVGQRRVG